MKPTELLPPLCLWSHADKTGCTLIVETEDYDFENSVNPPRAHHRFDMGVRPVDPIALAEVVSGFQRMTETMRFELPDGRIIEFGLSDRTVVFEVTGDSYIRAEVVRGSDHSEFARAVCAAADFVFGHVGEKNAQYVKAKTGG